MARYQAILAASTLLPVVACSIPSSPAETPPPAETGVWSAGLNDRDQLGRGGTDMDVAFGRVSLPTGKVTAVAAGSRHSLALRADGRVLAWGSNENGQLGDGTRLARAAPVEVLAPEGQGVLRDVTAVSARGNFSMALRADGTVVTWGSGGQGQRGTGRVKAKNRPTVVLAPDRSGPLTGVAAIAAGSHSALARLTDGSLLSWGANWDGMLGNGDDAPHRALPAPVRGPDGREPLTGVIDMAVGHRHMIALRSDGKVFTWGKNKAGQLGDGTRTSRPLPGPVHTRDGAELSGITSIAAGDKHNLAVRADRTVLAWGDNQVGQLGDGTQDSADRPVPVVSGFGPVLRGVERVHAGPNYSLAIEADGSVLTWGSGSRGQLGSGTRLQRNRPGPIVLAGGARSGDVVGAAAGDRHLVLLMCS